MKPTILHLPLEKNGVLQFTVSNINVSYANAIRRVILSEVPTVVFRTFPHEKNDANFEINTGRLNNEILKQRLSCIPIHIVDLDTPLENYIMEVDINNDSDIMIYVTTKDFKIRNAETNVFLNDAQLNIIFPPDPISHQYVDFCRLRPKLSDSIPGERLKLNCKFSWGTAKENGCFNVVSTSTYANTPNYIEIEKLEQAKKIEFEEKYPDDSEEVLYQLQDWKNLDAKRIYEPDSFDFKIETVGVFDNKSIVKKALNILIKKLEGIIDLYSTQNNLIKDSEATIPNSFDIILEQDDYTIGKILEYTLYKTYYLDTPSLTYCGFRKPHPHINISIIRLGFKQETDKNTVAGLIQTVAKLAIVYYKELLTELGESADSFVKTEVLSAPQPKSEYVDPEADPEASADVVEGKMIIKTKKSKKDATVASKKQVEEEKDIVPMSIPGAEEGVEVSVADEGGDDDGDDE